jgi:hypothetical protein
MPTSKPKRPHPSTVAAKVALPAVPPAPSAPAVHDDRSYRARYLDEVAPASIAGRLVKFDKSGNFVCPDTDESIDPNEDFVALADETLIGWIKFSPDGEPPDRRAGLLYEGFILPPRESLGDLNQAKWPIGLSGQNEDPWRHQIMLVLQRRGTGELFTFATVSPTGRRAVGTLLRHSDRLRSSHPDHYPVVRLKPSGFTHRDERIGWVATPSFAVVGRAPKASAATPDTSLKADLNDALPF